MSIGIIIALAFLALSAALTISVHLFHGHEPSRKPSEEPLEEPEPMYRKKITIPSSLGEIIVPTPQETLMLAQAQKARNAMLAQHNMNGYPYNFAALMANIGNMGAGLMGPAEAARKKYDEDHGYR